MTDLARLVRRPDARFLILFLAILGLAFTVVALRPVNDALVVPYTGFVARLSGAVLSATGEEISVDGCNLRSPRFAVTIYNGCNGLVTSLILIAGVLAFPASWRSRAFGIAAGLAAIQIINLLRIIALYYTGAFLPNYFDAAHVVVWQSAVILAGVAIWVVWARWASALPRRQPR